jgi:hypothetical protein
MAISILNRRAARRKESLGRPRCKWEDNINIDVREVGWDGLGSSGSK